MNRLDGAVGLKCQVLVKAGVGDEIGDILLILCHDRYGEEGDSQQQKCK